MASQLALTTPNSQQNIEGLRLARHLRWAGPLVMVISRSVLALIVQGLVALLFAFRGDPTPWLSAAPWWTVYATLIDLACLALLFVFTRQEGIRLWDLIGLERRRLGRDLLLGIGFFIVLFPVAIVGGTMVASFLVYGTMTPDIPAALAQRQLPLWGTLYSLFIWWIIWGATEEITYQGYALPRLQALTGKAWLAVLIVSFWLALQHSFLPLIPDWYYVLWRFLVFVPISLAMPLIYLRTRRLLPLIVAHWAFDLIGAFMTLVLPW
jgi:membrane protease YdiL (CAAX protease family)